MANLPRRTESQKAARFIADFIDQRREDMAGDARPVHSMSDADCQLLLQHGYRLVNGYFIKTSIDD